MGRFGNRLSPARLLAGFVFEVASAALVVGVPGAWLLRHMDLAALAAATATTALDRQVTIASLRITPGRTLGIELADAMVANLDGSPAPHLARLHHLSATIDARSLLHGPLSITAAAIDGLDLRLERLPDRTPNWRFAPPHPNSGGSARANFPSLRSLTIRDSAITLRAGSGHDLVTRIDSGAIASAADDQPATLALAGSYKGTPVTLDADLQSIAALRDTTRPYGTDLRFASNDLRLRFQGTMTRPFDLDGAIGTLDLAAPDPAPLYAIAAASGPEASLYVSGPFEHTGALWRLHDASGTLQTAVLPHAMLAFVDAPHGQQDRVALDLAFDSLDIDDIRAAGSHDKRASSDTSLTIERTPDTLVDLRLTARSLDYAAVHATDATLAAALTNGALVVETLSLTTAGTRLRAEGRIDAAPGGGRVTADVQALGADIQGLRRELGFGAIPLTGRLDAQIAIAVTAATLDTALRTARVSAVIVMRGGSVDRSVVEKASTDLRTLFRSSRGTTPVTCLLMGVDMRGGVGTVAPLRLRAAEGTLAGSARFDLNRRTLDLTIGSEARTTGIFALDIPVRVAGPFASPTVSPAQWTQQGRAQLAAADDLSRLPSPLQAFARRYPCAR